MSFRSGEVPKFGALEEDTVTAPAEKSEAAPQPKTFNEKLADARALGKERVDKAGTTAAGYFKSATNKFSNFLNRAKQYAENAAHSVAATPEILRMSAEHVQEKVDSASERAWQYKEQAKETLIMAPARNAAEWGVRKGEQVRDITARGLEMSGAVALAVKERTAEGFSNAVAKTGETYRGVKQFGAESMAFARVQMASAMEAMERRRDENRLEQLRARMARDAEEAGQIEAKLRGVRAKRDLRNEFYPSAVAA